MIKGCYLSGTIFSDISMPISYHECIIIMIYAELPWVVCCLSRPTFSSDENKNVSSQKRILAISK